MREKVKKKEYTVNGKCSLKINEDKTTGLTGIEEEK